MKPSHSDNKDCEKKVDVVVESAPVEKPIEVQEEKQKLDVPDTMLYSATDKDLVVFFFARDIDYYRKMKKPGYRTVFYFEKALIEEALRIWQSAAPIMMDIRKIFAAERIFNAAIHDDA